MSHHFDKYIPYRLGDSFTYRWELPIRMNRFLWVVCFIPSSWKYHVG